VDGGKRTRLLRSDGIVSPPWDTAPGVPNPILPTRCTRTSYEVRVIKDGKATLTGGQIIGAVRFPTNNPDFAPFVQKAKDAKPDVLFIFVPGGTQATAMIKAIKDLGLREAGINVVSTQDLVPDEELGRLMPRRQSIVEITLADGTKLREHVDSVRGTAANPMTSDEIRAKARDLMAPTLGQASTSNLIERVFELEKVMDIRELRPLLQRT